MSFQGIEFSAGMKKMVVNANQFFKLNRKNHDLFKNSASIDLTSKAMGISKSNIGKIIASFNQHGEESFLMSNFECRGKPSFSIENGLETTLRKYIRELNRSGQQVTLDVITKILSSNYNINVCQTTLWRALIRWGFVFGKGARSARLKESSRVIIQRREYLRSRIYNRRGDGTAIKPEIYLDESYINKNHSRDASWFFEDEKCTLSKPTGKGERLIIVNAISKDGWIPNAKLVFPASKKTTDYHANMNWNKFREWFENVLIPNIPDKSMIIMDNAQYHNVLAEETFPKKSTTIFQMKYWLLNNNIPYHEDMIKEELFELCKRFAQKSEFAIDKIAAKYGHSILRTPPYHPELQPIETCWAVVKSHVAKHNDFTMNKVKELLEEGFEKVTPHTIESIIKKIQKTEDEFWLEDSQLEAEEDTEEEGVEDDDFDKNE